MLRRASLSSTLGRRAWQKAGANPVGAGAEPQVEAGRLNLVGIERTSGGKLAGIKERLDCAI
jgi:hypothetical protein